MDIDEMIDRLQRLRAASPLKGQTMIHLCIPDYGDQTIDKVFLEESNDGETATVLIESLNLNQIIMEHSS